jgi:hypothetical protein
MVRVKGKWRDKMKKTLNIGKLILLTALGSLLWAGCASNAGDVHLATTVDLLNRGPSTYPQYGPDDMIFGYAAQSWWNMEDIE